MGWTIFTAIDLFIGAFLIDMMSTTVPPEKLPCLRKARNVTLLLFGISRGLAGAHSLLDMRLDVGFKADV